MIEQHRKALGALVGIAEIERCVPAELVGIVFRGRRFARDIRLRDGRNASFSVSRNCRNTVSTGTSTTRRDEAGECRKFRSLLRLVRSSSRVRIRSRPISVLPVRKSALMLGADALAVSFAPFCIAFLCPNRHF